MSLFLVYPIQNICKVKKVKVGGTRVFLAPKYDCKGESYTLLIDSDIVLHEISQVLIRRLGMTTEPFSKQYQVAWVNGDNITITSKCKMEFFTTCKKTI